MKITRKRRHEAMLEQGMHAGNTDAKFDPPPQPVRLLPCRFCGNLPGTKVGPPALARCITDGCEGKQSAADTLAEWNARAALALPSQNQFVSQTIQRGDG